MNIGNVRFRFWRMALCSVFVFSAMVLFGGEVEKAGIETKNSDVIAAENIWSGNCADISASLSRHWESIKDIPSPNAPTLPGEKLHRIAAIVLGPLDDHQETDQWPVNLLRNAIHRSNGYHPEMYVKERMARLLRGGEITADDLLDATKWYISRDYALIYRSIPEIDKPARLSWDEIMRVVFHYGMISRTDHEKQVRALRGLMADHAPRTAAQMIFNLFSLAPDNPFSGLAPTEYLERMESARRQSNDFFEKMERKYEGMSSKQAYTAIVDFWNDNPHASGALFLGYDSALLGGGAGVQRYQGNRALEIRRWAEQSATPADFVERLKRRAQYRIPKLHTDSHEAPILYGMQQMVYDLYRTEKSGNFTHSDIDAIVDAYFDSRVSIIAMERKLLDQQLIDQQQDKASHAPSFAFIECKLKFIAESREDWRRVFAPYNMNADQKMEFALAYWLKRAYADLGCYAVPGMDLPEYYRRVQREYPKLLNGLIAKEMDKEESVKAVLAYWESNPMAASYWIPDPDLKYTETRGVL